MVNNPKARTRAFFFCMFLHDWPAPDIIPLYNEVGHGRGKELAPWRIPTNSP